MLSELNTQLVTRKIIIPPSGTYTAPADPNRVAISFHPGDNVYYINWTEASSVAAGEIKNLNPPSIVYTSGQWGRGVGGSFTLTANDGSTVYFTEALRSL